MKETKCEFCSNIPERNVSKYYGLELVKYKDEIILCYDDLKYSPEELPVNFCPICGRELKSKKKQSKVA